MEFSMDRILLVEDDEALSTGIKMVLENDKVEIVQCFLISEARCVLKEKKINLVILDINLPDGNGLDFLKEIKQGVNLPVIMLTARDMETDIVAGLSCGADDYITKPFSLAILRARVEVQLRKKDGLSTVQIGDYVFDFERQKFEKAGKEIELSQVEEKILKTLIRQKGSVVTREQLENYVWGDSYYYLDTNTLSVALKRLRNKLEDSKYIKTIYGSGYSWRDHLDE